MILSAMLLKEDWYEAGRVFPTKRIRKWAYMSSGGGTWFTREDVPFAYSQPAASTSAGSAVRGHVQKRVSGEGSACGERQRGALDD